MDFRFIIPWLLLSLKTVLSLDQELSCAVCRALVDEVNYSISKVDPKKKIQVGSFRVDSKGNQGTYEKPYARSEVHLLEIFESICNNFKNYAESTNRAGKQSVSRTEARDGKALSLSNIKLSGGTAQKLQHKCESLIEEFEDDMIALFSKESVPDIENVLCVETTSECTEEDMKIPMPTTEFVYTPGTKPSDTDKTEETEETDEELVEEFIKDNTDRADGIPADTVIDQTVRSDSSPPAGDQNKEEL